MNDYCTRTWKYCPKKVAVKQNNNLNEGTADELLNGAELQRLMDEDKT